MHSHLPYCRRAGRWPHGEEWIHEAAAGTYLPLLDALYDLREEGSPFRLTLGLTPVLVEQLADPLVLGHLEEFLREKIARAEQDLERFQKMEHGHLSYLARYYSDWYHHILECFQGRFHGDLIGAFRRLQDEEHLEIATSAATHAYLPLLERDSSIYAQMKAGIEAYRLHFRCAPRSFWLPECGYRPAFYTEASEGAYIKPGLEEFLAAQGITCFFAETHTIEGGEPVGKARGEVLGPYANIPRRYVVPVGTYAEPTHKTTFQPYWVQRPEVATLGRNNRTGLQVWSGEWGYPGDFRYREFHRKDGLSGLHYWKVSGARVDLGEKELYDPYWAFQCAAEHSAHFAGLVGELIWDYHQQGNRYGIVVAAYDSELFGHWWFEGVSWIKEVLRRLSQSEVVEVTTASDFIAEHPPEDVLALPESSWGQGGGHFTWSNVDTQWLWPIIHAAERRMETLVECHPKATGVKASLLNQAARELLLLESSDWPFLVTTGQASEYAIGRFQEHNDRFHRLADMVESGREDAEAAALAQDLFERDKIFPEIDYRFFQEREGKAG